MGGKKKNWMVSEFFEEWIREMDDKLYKQQNQALVVNNCPACDLRLQQGLMLGPLLIKIYF